MTSRTARAAVSAYKGGLSRIAALLRPGSTNGQTAGDGGTQSHRPPNRAHHGAEAAGPPKEKGRYRDVDRGHHQNEALVQVYAIVSTVEKEMEQLGTSTHEFYFQCVKPELDKLAPLY